MKIGYCVEGATDRAVLSGLQRRWCPQAELVEGRFRGTTGLRLRAEIPSICMELDSKHCDIIVFLTDTNERDFTSVDRQQRHYVPEEFKSRVVSGVAARNIESWLCCDRDWIATKTKRVAAEFDVDDLKPVFEVAMNITSLERQEVAIADLVYSAPIKQWIERSRSFERFYEEARDLSKTLGCLIPNEREVHQAR